MNNTDTLNTLDFPFDADADYSDPISERRQELTAELRRMGAELRAATKSKIELAISQGLLPAGRYNSRNGLAEWTKLANQATAIALTGYNPWVWREAYRDQDSLEWRRPTKGIRDILTDEDLELYVNLFGAVVVAIKGGASTLEDIIALVGSSAYLRFDVSQYQSRLSRILREPLVVVDEDNPFELVLI